MKFNIFTAVVALMATAILTGCTNAKKERMETYSQRQADVSMARNVALYSSLTEEDGPLLDIPRSDLPNNLKGASDHEVANTFDSVGLTTLGIAQFNGFAVPSGMSVAGAMSIVGGLFLPDRAPHPALRHQILAWMPVDAAQNGEEAAARLKGMVKQAFIDSMPEGYTYTERKEIKTPVFGAPFTKLYPTIEGPGCPNDQGLECRVWWSIGEKPMVATAPIWSGSQEESYAWLNWPDGADEPDYSKSFSAFFLVQYARRDYDYGLHRNDWLEVHGHDLFHKMSSKLPNWIFLYTPPGKDHPYPAIFNNGVTHLFVEPQ